MESDKSDEIKELYLNLAAKIFLDYLTYKISLLENVPIEGVEHFGLYSLSNILRKIFEEVKSPLEFIISKLENVGYYGLHREEGITERGKKISYAIFSFDPVKPLLLEGPPGCGKTYLAEKFYEALRIDKEFRLFMILNYGRPQVSRTLRSVVTLEAEEMEDIVLRGTSYLLALAFKGFNLDLGEDAKTEVLNKCKSLIKRYDERVRKRLSNLINSYLENPEGSESKKDDRRGLEKALRALDIIISSSIIRGGSEKRYERALGDSYPIFLLAFSKEELEEGVIFLKYMCGDKDSFERVFGRRDYAKRAILSNALPFSKSEDEVYELLSTFEKISHGRDIKEAIELARNVEDESLRKLVPIFLLFRFGPLGRGRLFPGISVVLIDEADKMDHKAQSAFLEVFDRNYVSIPYVGRLYRLGITYVFLTSNEFLSIIDPMVRRTDYLRLDAYSTEELEEIINNKISPKIEALSKILRRKKGDLRKDVQRILNYALNKIEKEGIRATPDEILSYMDAVLRYMAFVKRAKIKERELDEFINIKIRKKKIA